jgi:hypothetical protein
MEGYYEDRIRDFHFVSLCLDDNHVIFFKKEGILHLPVSNPNAGCLSRNAPARAPSWIMGDRQRKASWKKSGCNSFVVF